MKKTMKTGFNWMALLFSSHYYAGYGKIPKAFILAALSGFPLFGLAICLYCGRKANVELPVGNTKFNWGLAMISVAIQMIVYFVLSSIIGYER